MLRWLSLLLLVFALASCGRSGVTPERPGGLPDLADLPSATLSRSASVADHELVVAAGTALDQSPAVLDPVQLGVPEFQLVPGLETNGFSWVLFGLTGFPTDGTITPQTLDLQRSDPCWVALANYSTSRWELHYSETAGEISFDAGADYVSAGGTVYVAVLASMHPANSDGATTITQLTLQTSALLPTATLRVLNAGGRTLEDAATYYDAVGSTGGEGSIIGVTYRFDGADEQTVGAVDTPVAHTWPTSGAHTVTVIVENDLGTSLARDFTVDAVAQDILVVYNSDMPESLALADYYSRDLEGRAVAPAFRLGLPLGTAFQQLIERVDYETQIRDPIRDYITTNNFADQLKYILLLKGVPHRINGTEDFDSSDGISSTASSVDSELCLLFSAPDPAGWVWNGPIFEGFTGTGYFLGTFGYGNDKPFAHGLYSATWRNPDGTGPVSTFPLDYLVGRIDAYTWAEATALVDRGIAPDTSGSGWALMDTTAARAPLDTMADPVWPLSNNSGNCGREVLNTAGLNNYLDVNDLTLQGNGTDGLPVGAQDAVIAYSGWGVNHGGSGYPSGADYINTDLQFTYLPGCAWISYESFNGTDFDDSDGINRRGQGQIADFLRMGGTCAIGNAWEPYTIGVGCERTIFYRYLVEGDPWIEAAYKGLRLLSWMEVVIGDPLCRVK